MLNLRAHHLICISRFSGTAWYNDECKGNAWRIFNEIQENPNQIVNIKNSCDDFCEKCPHIKEGICSKPSKYKISHWVRVMDNKTLRLIKIKPDTNQDISKLIDKVIEKIKDEELKTICKGCEYLPTCIEFGINKSFIKP